MNNFTLNEIYWDSKRKAYCELVAITPYKQRSKGHYLDFRYLDRTHIRKPSHEAAMRFTYADFKEAFETQNEVLEKFSQLPEFNHFDVPVGIGKSMSATAFQTIVDKLETSPNEEIVFSPQHPIARAFNKMFESFTPKRVKYPNVIYVDFILKVRIEIE